MKSSFPYLLLTVSCVSGQLSDPFQVSILLGKVFKPNRIFILEKIQEVILKPASVWINLYWELLIRIIQNIL